MVGKGQVEGEVIHIDPAPETRLPMSCAKRWKNKGLRENWITCAGKTVINSIQQTYGRVAAGKALALTGSSGFIEIADQPWQCGIRTGPALRNEGHFPALKIAIVTRLNLGLSPASLPLSSGEPLCQFFDRESIYLKSFNIPGLRFLFRLKLGFISSGMLLV